MKTITEVIADGLDASTDGRGWSARHERARKLADASPELLRIAKAYHNFLRTQASSDVAVATFQHIGETISKAEGK